MLLILQSAKMEKGPMSLHSRDDIGMIYVDYLSPSPTASFLRARQKILYKDPLKKIIYYLHCTNTSEYH